MLLLSAETPKQSDRSAAHPAARQEAAATPFCREKSNLLGSSQYKTQNLTLPTMAPSYQQKVCI